MTTHFMPKPRGPASNEPAVLEQFRRALQEQRLFRIEQLSELEATLPALDDPLCEVKMALRAAAHSALTEVDAALERMKAGQYGRCVRCHHDITLERLEIVPMAALCMNCQRRSESRRPDGRTPAGR